MISIKYKDGANEIYNSVGHQLHGSMSPDMFGLNPKELLEASLALCVSITLTKILERDGINFEDDEIDIKVIANKTDGSGNRFTDFSIAIIYPELNSDYKKKIQLMIEKGCTISNTLKNGATIEIIEHYKDEI